MKEERNSPGTPLHEFIAESNRIESIMRVMPLEVEAHEKLLTLSELTVEAIEEFVWSVASAQIRDRAGSNVRIGSHVPPSGSPEIYNRLYDLLQGLEQMTPYWAHVSYEMLHPFMDGNGRSGRAIWAWHMQQTGVDPFALPFLHRFYYQTLEASRT